MRLAWWVGAALTLAALGCGPKVEFEEDTDSSGGSGTEVTISGGSTTAQTTFDTTTTTSVTTSASTVTTSGPTTVTATVTGPGTTTFPTATITVTGPTTSGSTTGGGAPNGEACMSDFDCASGFCYVAGILGGICGECNSDADCPLGGCSAPNPLDGTWAECNTGGFGDGCDTNEACTPPLLCSEIIDVPGVITEATCGECQFDSDCMGLCSPYYDIPNFSGAWFCADPASLSNGNGCAVFGTGDQVCISGHCAAADVMGLFVLGVCSECETNADCPNNGTCNAPEVDLNQGLIPGFCG
jgi:hypothetical protein